MSLVFRKSLSSFSSSFSSSSVSSFSFFYFAWVMPDLLASSTESVACSSPGDAAGDRLLFPLVLQAVPREAHSLDMVGR